MSDTLPEDWADGMDNYGRDPFNTSSGWENDMPTGERDTPVGDGVRAAVMSRVKDRIRRNEETARILALAIAVCITTGTTSFLLVSQVRGSGPTRSSKSASNIGVAIAPTEQPTPTSSIVFQTPVATETVTVTPVPEATPTVIPSPTATSVPTVYKINAGDYCTNVNGWQIANTWNMTTEYVCDGNNAVEQDNTQIQAHAPIALLVFNNPDSGQFNGRTTTITANVTGTYKNAVEYQQTVNSYSGIALLDSPDGSSFYSMSVNMQGHWMLLHIQNGEVNVISQGDTTINQQGFDLGITYQNGQIQGSINGKTLVQQAASGIYALPGTVLYQTDGIPGAAEFGNLIYQQQG